MCPHVAIRRIGVHFCREVPTGDLDGFYRGSCHCPAMGRGSTPVRRLSPRLGTARGAEQTRLRARVALGLLGVVGGLIHATEDGFQVPAFGDMREERMIRSSPGHIEHLDRSPGLPGGSLEHLQKVRLSH